MSERRTSSKRARAKGIGKDLPAVSSGPVQFALSVTRRPDRAEDAVQQAFERLWRSGSRPAGDRVAYVFAAVRNAALDQNRTERSEATMPVSMCNG